MKRWLTLTVVLVATTATPMLAGGSASLLATQCSSAS